MAAAPQPRSLQLTSVGQGLRALTLRAEGAQPPSLQPFVVAGIKGGEAGALRSLLGLRLPGPGGALLGGPVVNHIPTESADRASKLVAVVKDHLLPALAKDPTARGLIIVVGACAGVLRADAAAAGGSFRVGATAFAGLLEAYIQQAQIYPADHAVLHGRIADLRRVADRFLNDAYTLRYDNDAPANQEEAAAGQAEEEAAAGQAEEEIEDAEDDEA